MRKRAAMNWRGLVLFAALLAAPGAHASEAARLQTAPIDAHDLASLQTGAKLFVNYCLNCHSAGYMRYNRLRDLGLTEPQIRDNLVFKMSDDDWDAVINTHLKGSFLAARAAQRHMVQQRYGKIVFISSTSALGNRTSTD